MAEGRRSAGQRLQDLLRRDRDDRPRPEDAGRAGRAQVLVVLGGITPPTTTRMSSRPCARSSAITSGIRVLCPPARVETPSTWTSFSTACRATSFGVWKSGLMSTSKPRSANAVAITFAPRSWPSCPIFATRIRSGRPSCRANAAAIARAFWNSASVSLSAEYTPEIVRCTAW